MSGLVHNYIEALFRYTDCMVTNREYSKTIVSNVRSTLRGYDRKRVLSALWHRIRRGKRRLYYAGHFGDRTPIWSEVYKQRLYLAIYESFRKDGGYMAQYYVESAMAIKREFASWFKVNK